MFVTASWYAIAHGSIVVVVVAGAVVVGATVVVVVGMTSGVGGLAIFVAVGVLAHADNKRTIGNTRLIGFSLSVSSGFKQLGDVFDG